MLRVKIHVLVPSDTHEVRRLSMNRTTSWNDARAAFLQLAQALDALILFSDGTGDHVSLTSEADWKEATSGPWAEETLEVFVKPAPTPMSLSSSASVREDVEDSGISAIPRDAADGASAAPPEALEAQFTLDDVLAMQTVELVRIPNPDRLLQRELASRLSALPWACNAMLQVSPDGRTVTKRDNTPGKHGVVTLRGLVTPGQQRSETFAVARTAHGNIIFGVLSVAAEANPAPLTPHLGHGDIPGSFGYHGANGHLYKAAGSVPFAPTFTAGDAVTVTVDFRGAPVVSYALNGRPTGTPVVVDPTPSALAFAISLYDATDVVTVATDPRPL